MPVPLGFWAAAGAGGGAAGPSYEQITTTVLSGLSSNVSLSSIPATYKHLQLRMVLQTSSSSNQNRFAGLRLNGDTAANYSSHELGGDGAAVGSTSQFQSYMEFRTSGQALPGWAAHIVDILDYASASKFKTTKMLGGYVAGNGNSYQQLASGNWRSTAAVNSIQIISLGGDAFVAGSRFSVYGIKG